MHICNGKAYERPKNLEGQLEMVVQMKKKGFAPKLGLPNYFWGGVFNFSTLLPIPKVLISIKFRIINCLSVFFLMKSQRDLEKCLPNNKKNQFLKNCALNTK